MFAFALFSSKTNQYLLFGYLVDIANTKDFDIHRLMIGNILSSLYIQDHHIDRMFERMELEPKFKIENTDQLLFLTCFW